MLIRFSIIVIILFLTGCAKSRYSWNGYDDKLYSYYKTPAESDRFMEALQEIIQESEVEGTVPPGIYAEYGYMLYERGKFPDAVIWYSKELEKWPESRILMEKMIAMAEKRKLLMDSKNESKNQPVEANKEKTP